jgi:hypothetical protein
VGDMYWIEVTQNGDRWKAFMNEVNVLVPKNV